MIAATNRNLVQDVKAGRFREDLWYRLNVFPISVPPLRQRKEDIPTLALAFVDRACQRLSKPALEVPRSVMDALQAREWPGNVRELQNLMEQAVLVSDGPTLRLPRRLRSRWRARPARPPAARSRRSSAGTSSKCSRPPGEAGGCGRGRGAPGPQAEHPPVADAEARHPAAELVLGHGPPGPRHVVGHGIP